MGLMGTDWTLEKAVARARREAFEEAVATCQKSIDNYSKVLLDNDLTAYEKRAWEERKAEAEDLLEEIQALAVVKEKG